MENKVAMITGASVGIGRAVALKTARNGAKLVLVDYNQETLAKVKDEVLVCGAEVEAFVCDVSKEDEVNNVVKEAFKRFGKVDILVNNAGIWRDFHPFLDVPLQSWKTYLDINVMGVVHCTRAVLPKMLENNYGRIVNIASVAGVYGNANMTMYSATKGAVISMTKALAKELAPKGIVLNCVSPGTVNDSSDLDINAFKESTLSYAGRTGTGAENADLICFLASEKNGYVIGQNILIDGCRKNI